MISAGGRLLERNGSPNKKVETRARMVQTASEVACTRELERGGSMVDLPLP